MEQEIPTGLILFLCIVPPIVGFVVARSIKKRIDKTHMPDTAPNGLLALWLLGFFDNKE